MTHTRRSLLILLASALTSPSAFAASVHTPPKGSAERQAIMDAMRVNGDDRDRIFVVRFLKVSRGWAWLQVDPQSRGGSNHYESESALLRQFGRHWKVVAQPCAEADCVEEDELARIRDDFPQAPDAIFP